uniref:Rab3 GTPase-activating protein catalytic subunit n=1 Tax=Schistocephalus solidus TaxID=70667 RepID=A0A183TSR0_SCHSO
LDSDVPSPPGNLISSSDFSMTRKAPGIQANLKLQSLAETLLEEVHSFLSAKSEGLDQSQELPMAAKGLLLCLEDMRKEMCEAVQTTVTSNWVPPSGDRDPLPILLPPNVLELTVDSQVANLCIGEVWSSIALRLEQRYRRWSTQPRDELLYVRTTS